MAPVGGEGFAEKLDEVAGGEASAEAPGLGDLEALAARIEAGELSPGDAMRQLVERVLDAQLGSDAPEELRSRAREFVENALAEDPHLASMTKRLRGPA